MQIDVIQRALQKLTPTDQPGLFLLAPDGLRVCMPGEADWKPVAAMIESSSGDDSTLRRLLEAIAPGVKISRTTLALLRVAAKGMRK
jgi:hypothetical protein